MSRAAQCPERRHRPRARVEGGADLGAGAPLCNPSVERISYPGKARICDLVVADRTLGTPHRREASIEQRVDD